ncbi:MAG: hypothetical protein IJW26_05575, partial [Clostridia bacterium]|nr:hypothetical protein [Clostridia bacterium]
LKKHVELAKEVGMKDSATFICDIGDTLVFNGKTCKMGEKFQAGSRFVDGFSIDETMSTIRDRKYISSEGIIVVVCCVSSESGYVLQEPDVIGKGAGFTESQLQDMKNIVVRCLESYNIKKAGEKTVVRNYIRQKLKDYIFKKTKKNPMILPVITEV